DDELGAALQAEGDADLRSYPQPPELARQPARSRRELAVGERSLDSEDGDPPGRGRGLPRQGLVDQWRARRRARPAAPLDDDLLPLGPTEHRQLGERQ